MLMNNQNEISNSFFNILNLYKICFDTYFSERDTWWPRHQMTCGGTYIKVKEPENFGKKKEKKEKPKEKGELNFKIQD